MHSVSVLQAEAGRILGSLGDAHERSLHGARCAMQPMLYSALRAGGCYHEQSVLCSCAYGRCLGCDTLQLWLCSEKESIACGESKKTNRGNIALCIRMLGP